MGKVREELLVGLDIGTSRVAVVVAACREGTPVVTGVGTAFSEGLRKGVVVNIESTVQAIARAVREAEVMAGCEIHSVFAGVAGNHIKAFNSHGVVAVRNEEVTQDDVDRVLDAARAVALPLDRDVLHVLPQQFVLDGQNGIKEPLGMAGVRLEARVHVVSAAVAATQNVVKCCQRAGLHVRDLFFTPLAAAQAVLAEEERELGTVVLDLGAGTTDVLVFQHGAVTHTAVVPVAGHHVTNDIAAGLQTPFRDAELLKRRHGRATVREVSPAEEVEVPGVGGRSARMVSRERLCLIIEARVEEIFALAAKRLEQAGFERTGCAGVVLTGGGANLPGCAELAEQIFRMPARVGSPLHIEGLPEVTTAPDFAGATGLILLGAQPRTADERAVPSKGLGRVRDRVLHLLRAFF